MGVEVISCDETVAPCSTTEVITPCFHLRLPEADRKLKTVEEEKGKDVETPGKGQILKQNIRCYI